MFGYPFPLSAADRISIPLTDEEQFAVEHAAGFVEDLWEALQTSGALLVWDVEGLVAESRGSFYQYSRSLSLEGARLHPIGDLLAGGGTPVGHRRPRLLVHEGALELWSLAPAPRPQFRSETCANTL